MLQRYYTDMVTDVPVSARQAFRFFCKVEDWGTWSDAVRYAKLFGGWKTGALLVFAPKFGKLPAAPLPVRILDFQQDREITWGVEVPGGCLKHRFTFIPSGEGQCRIHHEEWSEGVVTLLAWPMAGLIRRFNDTFARELAAMF